MERRHFISLTGGLGLGLLIPGAVNCYLMRGVNVGDTDVRGYLDDGAQARRRYRLPQHRNNRYLTLRSRLAIERAITFS